MDKQQGIMENTMSKEAIFREAKGSTDDVFFNDDGTMSGKYKLWVVRVV